MNEIVLNVENLIVELKSDFFSRPQRILHEVCFQVPKGEIYGFLGPNGSGKTTTIKSILGLIPKFVGTIQIFGSSSKEISNRQRIGYSPENAYFSNFLTPNEVLNSMGVLSGMSTTSLTKSSNFWLDRLQLSHVRNQVVSTFSKGMKQRLNLIQSLLHDPDFIILDEPTTGLDPIGKKEVKNLILELKSSGKTVLVCTHNLLEAQEFCDQICIIDKGKLVKQGELNSVLLEGKNLEESFISYVTSGGSQ